MNLVDFDTSWTQSDQRVGHEISNHLEPGGCYTDDDIYGILINKQVDISEDRVRHGRLWMTRNNMMVKGPNRKPTTRGGYAQTWVMLKLPS